MDYAGCDAFGRFAEDTKLIAAIIWSKRSLFSPRERSTVLVVNEPRNIPAVFATEIFDVIVDARLRRECAFQAGSFSFLDRSG